MKKSKKQYPATSWKKEHTRPCPSGRCKHRHVRGSGPCCEVGCSCSGAVNKKER